MTSRGTVELSSIVGARSWLNVADGEETKTIETEAMLEPGPETKQMELGSSANSSDMLLNCRLAISCSGSYCLIYWLRFPIFMLSDDISKQLAFTMFGINVTLQEGLSLVFCIGFGLAKIPAIYLTSSSIYYTHRFTILCAIAISSGFLSTVPLALSGGMPGITLCSVFLASFPSSMLYGGLVSYVEGRRSTELLVAVLHFCSTFAGSLSKGTATAVLNTGLVETCWMPGVIASVVTPLLVICLWVLDRSPPPSAGDIAARQPRQAMSAQERAEFVNSFRSGLTLLILSYSMLSALRFFRDLFGRDIFTAANGGVVPSAFVFATADLPGAIAAAGILIVFLRIEDSSRAVLAMIVAMFVGIIIMLIATMCFSIDLLGCVSWQMILSVGLFGSMSLACMPIYDRLVAASSLSAKGVTCTFLIFYGDCVGYVAAVGLTMWKIFFSGSSSAQKVLEQFMWALGILGIGMMTCLLAAHRYFRHRLKQHSPSIE